MVLSRRIYASVEDWWDILPCKGAGKPQHQVIYSPNIANLICTLYNIFRYIYIEETACTLWSQLTVLGSEKKIYPFKKKYLKKSKWKLILHILWICILVGGKVIWSMISVGWVGSVGGEAWWDRRQIGSLGETTRDQDLFRFVLDFLPLGDQDLFGFIFRFLSTEGEKACLGHRQRPRDHQGLGFDPWPG